MSWMITGIEVETTVLAIIETNMPSRRPVRAWSTERWRAASAGARSSEGAPAGATASGAGEVGVMGSFGGRGGAVIDMSQ